MKIKKTVFNEIDYKEPIPFIKIKHIVQDDDLIFSGFDEGFYSENQSTEPHFFMTIESMVEETEEEKQNRLDSNRKNKEELKERRYKSYLKLKKEFENVKD